MDNAKLDLLCQKLSDDLISGSLDEAELDRRIFDVKTRLGLLEQMLKLPSPARLHKIMALRGMVRDVFGVRGEVMTVGGS